MSLLKYYQDSKIYDKNDLKNLSRQTNFQLPNNLVIRISGFAGAGKGTLANNFLQKYEILHIESSLILRACSYVYLDKNLPLNLENTGFVFSLFEVEVENHKIYISYEGKKLGYPELKTDRIDRVVANYAIDHQVRLEFYKKLANFVSKNQSASILDGRGVETPYLKKMKEQGMNIFNISLCVDEKHGLQRYLKEAEEKGLEKTAEDYQKSIVERNLTDIKMMKKEGLPLYNKETYIINTSNMSADEVFYLTQKLLAEHLEK